MLYKWPQGKVLRTILLLLAVLLAGDLGFSSYGQYVAFVDAGSNWGANWSQVAICGILGLLALIALVGGAVAVGFKARSAQFIIEVEQEMARVTWPTGSEIRRLTVVIAIMATILAVMVFLVDLVNQGLLDSLLGRS